MINWNKLIEEQGLVEPSEVGCSLDKIVTSNLWKICSNIYAVTYINSSPNDPLVMSYIWTHRDEIAKWILNKDTIENHYMQRSKESEIPNIWSISNINKAQSLKDVADCLSDSGIKYIVYPKYCKNVSRSTGSILAFGRTHMYFWRNEINVDIFVGFQVFTNSPVYGGM